MFLRTIPVVAAVAVLTAAPVRAQDESPAPATRPALEIAVTAGVYLPRLGGTSSLGTTPLARDLDFELDLDLDDLEPSLNVELALRKADVWRLHLSGLDFSTEGRATIRRRVDFGSLELAPGDVVRSSFDLTTVAVELGFAYWRPFQREGANEVDFRFSPALGFRYVDVDQGVRVVGGGGTESTGGEWAIPYAGLVMELEFAPVGGLPFGRSIGLHAMFGAGPVVDSDGGFMWQVRAGLTWYLTENVGFEFGYRLVELDVENDEYELDGGLQGLFVGGTVRF